MDFLPAALMPFSNYKQFVVYVILPSATRAGKTDKIPIDANTGQLVNHLDPANQLTANDALSKIKNLPTNCGIGFVFTEHDPFWFLDIDHAYDSINKSWSLLSTELCTLFNGAALEVSSSGDGLHLFGTCRNLPAHSTRNKVAGLEFYSQGRFVALTGLHAGGDAAFDASHILPDFINTYFPPKIQLRPNLEWSHEPVETWSGSTNDDELIQRALRSHSVRSAFGGGASFCDLWMADTEKLKLFYPADTKSTDDYNRSSADAALAQHLCFWTGNNCERIKNIMLRSGLAREKWNREDYLTGTILNACSMQREFLIDKKPEENSNVPAMPAVDLRPQLVTGSTFLTVEQQRELFNGCVYICDTHTVLVPGGICLEPKQFETMYAGYTMPLDLQNEKVSKNPWETFTKSQCFKAPRVNTGCFRPDLSPSAIIEQDGLRQVNIYWPVHTARKTGDLTPFYTHLEKLFPWERDRKIILSYMAAIVQFKGKKFQWCPLIQGVEGNGKTLLSIIVRFAVGNRYSHFPKASDISGKYNEWEYGKIFIGVEDIYLPHSQQEVLEQMKPMITGDFREVEPKHKNKMTKELCHNFILNSNHKEGLRKVRNDRRFCPFYTPQQSVDDLVRDGLTADFFYNYWTWLKADGLAIINNLMHAYQIPEEHGLRALMGRAPETTSTKAAIEHGASAIEQEILEAIEQQLLGFKGGWISSVWFDRLLDNLKLTRSITYNKRRELLQGLGYDWHPGLINGRVNNAVQPEGSRPKLYIKVDHPSAGLRDYRQIEKWYEKDQK